MTDKFVSTQLATPRRPGLMMPRAPAAPDVAPHFQREERIASPTIAQGLLMLARLYGDLLALALWRRLSTRFPKEAREVNS